MCADYALRRKGEYVDIADQGIEADPGAAWQGLENQDEGALLVTTWRSLVDRLSC